MSCALLLAIERRERREIVGFRASAACVIFPFNSSSIFWMPFEWCHDAFLSFQKTQQYETKLTPHALHILVVFAAAFVDVVLSFFLCSLSLFLSRLHGSFFIRGVYLHSRRQISYFASLACTTVARMSISITMRIHTHADTPAQSIRQRVRESESKGTANFEIEVEVNTYNQQMTKIGESNSGRNEKKGKKEIILKLLLQTLEYTHIRSIMWIVDGKREKWRTGKR